MTLTKPNHSSEYRHNLEKFLKRFDPRWPRQHPTTLAGVLGLYGSGMNVYWQQFPAICSYFDFEGAVGGFAAKPDGHFCL